MYVYTYVYICIYIYIYIYIRTHTHTIRLWGQRLQLPPTSLLLAALRKRIPARSRRSLYNRRLILLSAPARRVLSPTGTRYFFSPAVLGIVAGSVRCVDKAAYFRRLGFKPHLVLALGGQQSTLCLFKDMFDLCSLSALRAGLFLQRDSGQGQQRTLCSCCCLLLCSCMLLHRLRKHT